jgi:hypothetical protein
MKARWRQVILVLASQLIVGCTTSYLARAPHDSPSVTADKAPIDLAPFWESNGFKLVDRDGVTQGVDRYKATNGQVILSIWEKWYKGVIFPYNGNIAAYEELKDRQYCILIIPLGGHQVEAAKVRDDLRQFLTRSYPSTKFAYEESQFFDLRQ